MSHVKGAPVTSPERTLVLDVLRGIALLGVLLVNVLTEFRVSIFEQFLPAHGESTVDHALSLALSIAVESKAFAVFSFLFGVGLAVQWERAALAGRAFAVQIARRLSALLVIGVVHLVLIWNGDILTLYALAGLVVAPFLRLRARWLAVLAALFLIAHVLPIPYPESFPDARSMRAHVSLATRAYAYGDYGDVLRFRIRELKPLAPLVAWASFRTVGLFFLGATAWRVGVFTKVLARAPLALVTTIALTSGFAAEVATSRGESLGKFQGIVSGWGPIVLALGYVATVLLLFQSEVARKILARVAPLGRMALTNYLLQSIVFGFIFYGYGLGQFGKMKMLSTTVLCFAVYGAQLLVSTWWLARYHFGPVEWLWRSATYGYWQPMRKTHDSASDLRKKA